MPPEPNRWINELLQELARRRRQTSLGEPWAMPDSMRARLNEEVRRRFAHADPPRWQRRFWNRIDQVWPRLVLYGGMAAFAALCGIWFLIVSPNSPQQTPPLAARVPRQLAQLDHRARESIPAPGVRMTGGIGVGGMALDGRQDKSALASSAPMRNLRESPRENGNGSQPPPALARNAGLNSYESSYGVNGPALARAGGITSGVSLSREPAQQLASAATRTSTFAAKTATPASPAERRHQVALVISADRENAKRIVQTAAPDVAVAARAGLSPNSQRQAGAELLLFQNTAPWAAPVFSGQSAIGKAAGAASAEIQLLRSFRVEQAGSRLDVVDGDGSIYSGAILSNVSAANAPAPRAAQSESFRPLAPASKPPPPASGAAESAWLPPRSAQVLGSYFFRVSGANRSLNQNVTFEGRLGSGNGTLEDLATNEIEALRRAPAASQTPGVSPLRIDGRAWVGGSNPLPVHAIQQLAR